MTIDTSFDFRTGMDGKDPDRYSEKLRKYHQFLWSKPLPTGGCLALDDQLVNHSDAGPFIFSSDSIIHTFSYWNSMQDIIRQIPETVIADFDSLSYTIGGMTIFPSNKVDGKYTINQERGTNAQIKDRLDLTLECIRLYYLGEDSPLYDCLSRYEDFFRLFGDFRGYIEFFLFQDIINGSDMTVRFMHPFTKFGEHVLPESEPEYWSYMHNCMDFLHKRNARISFWTRK